MTADDVDFAVRAENFHDFTVNREDVYNFTVTLGDVFDFAVNAEENYYKSPQLLEIVYDIVKTDCNVFFFINTFQNNTILAQEYQNI